jgi:hypothetical protein
MCERGSHPVAPIFEAFEQLAHRRVIHWPALRISEKVPLTHVSDVGGILVLREQVIKRLVAPRADVLGDRLVPLFGIGEDRVDVEDDPAEGEQAVSYHVADSEAGAGLTGRDYRASGLAREELCAFHAGNMALCGRKTSIGRASVPDMPVFCAHGGLGKREAIR